MRISALTRRYLQTQTKTSPSSTVKQLNCNDGRLRLSKLFVPTVKETPSDAVAKSHILLTRAGFIRKSGSAGLYSFLPMAVRVLEKLERLIDTEMERIGGQKLKMSSLSSAEGWKITGRWHKTGPELFTLQDRKGNDFCLAPTHEEDISSLIASEVSSYRDLPLRVYQIGPKYRDEIRPRFGLLRCREFIMKDMYSFDATVGDAESTYEQVAESYSRIFRALDLPYRRIAADSGNIGGSLSHEYVIPCNIGEGSFLSCTSDQCSYSADRDLAKGAITHESNNVTHYLSRSTTDGDEVLIIVPEGREVSPIKLSKVLNETEPRSIELMRRDLNYGKDRIIVDSNVQTEFNNSTRASVIFAETNDKCLEPNCQGTLAQERGIEVGHIFYLGHKYSRPLRVRYVDEQGKSQLVHMGCFGIGVSRLLAAIVEYHSTSTGLRWSSCIAPYQIVIISSGKGSNDTKALEIYDELNCTSHFHSEVVFDDRSVSLGSKLKQADLIGFPYVIVVGREAESRDVPHVEIHCQSKNEKFSVPLDQVKSWLMSTNL